MKKFLSLVLALVMTMSLVTVSAGAKDFDDNADITYVEAVDVMSDLKIVDGDKSGNFNPTAGLTRGAAAKIICNLILGPTTAAELNADTAPYPDVAQDSTFAGYIAYCQKEGIISGYADGTFKPANPLTGYAFMKMLLGALGYDPAVEGYTGANWSINVAKQAIGIGLNAGLVDNFNGSDFVTREEAMLYAFNTLQATMVDYDTTIVVGDITIAGSKAADVANNARTETLKDDNKMQFAEKYFTKLTVKADTDAFERPANTWVIGKETIGTYVDYTKIVAEYTTAVSGKELYDVTGKTAFNDYEFEAYVDGVANDLYKEIAKNNKGDIEESGNGALTQVFVNNDAETVVITVVNTYLAQATTDYSAKKDSVNFKVYTVDGTYKTYTVSGEDFDIADVVTDDFALVTVADKAIQSIADVEVIEDTEIQKFSSGKDGSITVDGTKYSYSEMAEYNNEVLEQYTIEGGKVTNLKDVTYNIYVDAYGYVIGVDRVETPDNYLFVTGVDKNSSHLANKTWTANAIFMDGTAANIEVKDGAKVFGQDGAIINNWYTYTVSSAGVYSLELVYNAGSITNTKTPASKVAQWKDDETLKIDAKNIALEGNNETVYGNDSTVYLLADMDKVGTTNVIVGVDEVVTGVKNAAFKTQWYTDLKAVAYPLYKSNGYVMAAVVVGESSTVASDLAYVISTGVSSESYDKTTKTWTWTRDVVIGGEEVELVETNDTGVSVLDDTTINDKWVTVKYDANGNVKDVVKVTKDIYDTVGKVVAEIKKDVVDTLVLDTKSSNHVYELKGSTLYDKTTGELGFLIAEDVKVVLNQTVKNKNTTTYDEGVKALEATLLNLNEKDPSYKFDAVIEDGIATVVIIIDEGKDAGYVGPTGTGAGSAYTAVVDKLNLAVNCEGKGAFENDKLGNAALAALEAEGYAFVKWDTTKYEMTVTNANGENIVFTVWYKEV